MIDAFKNHILRKMYDILFLNLKQKWHKKTIKKDEIEIQATVNLETLFLYVK